MHYNQLNNGKLIFWTLPYIQYIQVTNISFFWGVARTMLQEKATRQILGPKKAQNSIFGLFLGLRDYFLTILIFAKPSLFEVVW